MAISNHWSKYTTEFVILILTLMTIDNYDDDEDAGNDDVDELSNKTRRIRQRENHT